MKVLFVSGLGGDTRRYRCLHHQEQLALQHIPSILCEADDYQLYTHVFVYDVLILHRVAYSPLIDDLIDLAHQQGKPVIFETDDLIFRPELSESIAFMDTLLPDLRRKFREDLAHQAQTFTYCDFVLTTTDYLANEARRLGKVAFVHRNGCSEGMIQAAEVSWRLREANQSNNASVTQHPLIIGYFSGTGSHNRDFATVSPALVEIMHRYRHVYLHVSGHLDLAPDFEQFTERIRRAPYVNWRELPNLLAQVDINLAPLEIDNPFCQSKSEIKYSEAALLAIPTIATPTDAYQFAIQSGKNGLLATTHEDWLLALTRLIEDAEYRKQLGTAARQQIYQHYTPEVRSQQLLATLQQMIDSYHPSIGTDRQLAQRAVQGMLGQITQLTEKINEQEQQVKSLHETLAGWEERFTQSPPEQHKMKKWEEDNQQLQKQVNFWRKRLENNEQKHLEELRGIMARLQSMNSRFE